MATAPYTLEQAEEAIADLRAQVDRLGEVHSIADGAVVPNTPDAGSYSMFSTQGQPAWNSPSGAVWGVVGAGAATFPNNTVTAASLQNMAAYTVKGGDPDAGALYEMDVWGTGTQASGARVALQFAVMLNGSPAAGLSWGTTAVSVASVNFRWRTQVRAICVSSGVAGVFKTQMTAWLSEFAGVSLLSSANSNTNAATSCDNSATSYVIDTTANFDVGCSAAWASTTGAPTLTSQQAIARKWS